VLRLHPRLAPVKVAVLPLLRKEGQPELAHEIHRAVRAVVQAEYDEGGSIGRRYRRQDEIGTPFCVTIDHQSLADRTVTLRDRDSLAQERIAIDGIAEEIERRVTAPWTTREASSEREEQHLMDFDLTDEAAPDLRDRARLHKQRDRVAVARKRAQHHFDVDLVRKVAAQGYLGAIVPASTEERASTICPTA